MFLINSIKSQEITSVVEWVELQFSNTKVLVSFPGSGVLLWNECVVMPPTETSWSTKCRINHFNYSDALCSTFVVVSTNLCMKPVTANSSQKLNLSRPRYMVMKTNFFIIIKSQQQWMFWIDRTRLDPWWAEASFLIMPFIYVNNTIFGFRFLRFEKVPSSPDPSSLRAPLLLFVFVTNNILNG